MPIYEYRCQGCASDFELLVRDQETPACPQCETTKIEKLLSVPAAPNMNGSARELPMAAASCAAPRCCGGGCQI